MEQLHRRFTVEQVKVLCHGYCQGTLSRASYGETANRDARAVFGQVGAYCQPINKHLLREFTFEF